MSLLDKTEFTQTDIENLLANQVEESIILDYKRGESLQISEASKKELAKDVSAFANSNGGLIIYGVEETDHIPTGYVYVDGNTITKEWIEQVIQTRIQRKIDGLRIFPVRWNNNIQESIYVVRIPESFDSPHMTSNKRFYKRYNFESVQMEEYEIRQAYNKTKYSKLEIDWPIIVNGTTGRAYQDLIETGEYKLWFHANNVGQVLDKDFKLEVKVPKSIVDNDIVNRMNAPKCLNNKVKFTNPTSDTFAITNESTIFPEEKYQFGYANIRINDVEQAKLLNIDCTLFYSGGTEKKQLNLEEIFIKHNER